MPNITSATGLPAVSTAWLTIAPASPLWSTLDLDAGLRGERVEEPVGHGERVVGDERERGAVRVGGLGRVGLHRVGQLFGGTGRGSAAGRAAGRGVVVVVTAGDREQRQRHERAEGTREGTGLVGACASSAGITQVRFTGRRQGLSQPSSQPGIPRAPRFQLSIGRYPHSRSGARSCRHGARSLTRRGRNRGRTALRYAVGIQTSVRSSTRTSVFSSGISSVSTAAAFASHLSAMAWSSAVSSSSSSSRSASPLSSRLRAVEPLLRRLRHAALARRAVRRRQDALGRLLAAEQRSEHPTGDRDHRVDAAARAIGFGLADTILGAIDGVTYTVGLLGDRVAQLGRLGVGRVVRRGGAAGREVLGGLSRPGEQLELAVVQDAERARAVEVVLQLLLGLVEVRDLGDVGVREHVHHARGRLRRGSRGGRGQPWLPHRPEPGHRAGR